jgi:hypothetical protein
MGYYICEYHEARDNISVGIKTTAWASSQVLQGIREHCEARSIISGSIIKQEVSDW